MARRRTLIACSIAVLLFATVARSLVMTNSKGTWPEDWPKALDPLRSSAKSIEIAAGSQEIIYEITFKDRETFASAWPEILKVKTPGAPITLRKPSPNGGPIVTNDAPIVRIHTPPRTRQTGSGENDQPLVAASPWPKEIVAADGALPEWVVAQAIDGQQAWVAAEKAPGHKGFRFRARTEIELIVDGKVIDLNETRLPENTPIVDKRF